ncbi:MAG TPA: hypothetical protein VFN97_00175 [Actinospica sp.]|nr:hypothetical protein [Actinospica sp.]
MSADNRIPSSTHGEVRIVYHADGSASVNDAPVAVGPGQDLRDAAYQAAVGLAVSSGATGPVVASSVEPDGAVYPVTLYPSAAALAAAETGAAGAATSGALDRVRRAWYQPTLRVSWLAAAACACVLVSVLATLLLHEDGPPVVSLSVDTENDPSHSPEARAMGHAIAKVPGVLMTESVRALAKKAAAAKPADSPTAAQPRVSPAPVPDIGAQPTPGLPPATQPSTTSAAPSPSAKPTPSPSSTKPAAVTNLTLALVGGDQSDQTIAYVATVGTSNTSPVTLTYTYSGTGGRASVTRTVQLSGHTNYVLADLIPAQPYCGGPVTMTATTSPIAKNGVVTATAQPGC